LYWGDAEGDRLSPNAVQTLSSAEVEAQAKPLFGPADANRYRLTVPARWGVPPTGTRSIVAILDPDNDVEETNEQNNVAALQIHTPDEVMRNSISPSITGSDTIISEFRPGGGIPSLTISEAEVVMGVDHFNWVQQVIDLPIGWTPITLENLDYSRILALCAIASPFGVRNLGKIEDGGR
jgi:hypothetical protein